MNEEWVTKQVIKIRKTLEDLPGTENTVSGIEPLQNAIVDASTWAQQEKPDVAGYPFATSIAYPGVTPDHYAMVVFHQNDAVSGYFANVCMTDTDTVKIYAKAQPVENITIATIIAMEVNQ